MRITKRSSNSTELLKTISIEELSPYEKVKDPNITFGDPEIISETTKCLGMILRHKTVVFNYHSYEELSNYREKL